MEKQQIIKIDALEVDSSVFSSYNIKSLQAIPILFQTGYLTIKKNLKQLKLAIL